MVRRVLAAYFDLALILSLAVLLFFALATERSSEVVSSSVFAQLTLGGTTYAVTGLTAGLYYGSLLIFGVLYAALLPGLTGVTLGKLIFGVRVSRLDGTVPAGFGRNLVRYMLDFVDYFPYVVPGLVGFIVAILREDRRRVGDLVGGTAVIGRGRGGVPIAQAQPAPPTGQPQRSEGLPPEPEGSLPPAGWYADPHGRARLRYWDGVQWTHSASG